MEAEKVAEELLHKDIISRGDQRTITRAEDPTLQNQVLHRCLKEKCTLVALRSVCATIKAVKGNPKMAALGNKMMRRLETGTVCVHVVWLARPSRKCPVGVEGKGRSSGTLD